MHFNRTVLKRRSWGRDMSDRAGLPRVKGAAIPATTIRSMPIQPPRCRGARRSTPSGPPSWNAIDDFLTLSPAGRDGASARISGVERPGGDQPAVRRRAPRWQATAPISLVSPSYSADEPRRSDHISRSKNESSDAPLLCHRVDERVAADHGAVGSSRGRLQRSVQHRKIGGCALHFLHAGREERLGR
jgi:hypothetical protein